MQIKFIFWCIPILIIEIEDIAEYIGGHSGICLGPICIVNDIKRTCLIEHEIEHSRQVFKSFFTMPILYLISKTAKLRYEAQAYAVQIKCNHPNLESILLNRYGYYLSSNYGLGISLIDAKNEIKRYL